MMTVSSILESVLEQSLLIYCFCVAPVVKIVVIFEITFQARKMTRLASVRGGKGAKVGGRGGASGGRGRLRLRALK